MVTVANFLRFFRNRHEVGAPAPQSVEATTPVSPLGDPSTAFSFSDPSIGAGDRDILTRVKDAIVAERIDLYLQPIVSLPQRKPRYYEAFSRLRDEEGRILKPVVYLEAAERANKIGAVDNWILTRCVEAVRRYGQHDAHLVVFVNLSPATLYDTEFFEAFAGYLRANADLASRLIFEFTFPSIHTMHPKVEANVAAIAELGFAFSLDHVHNLNFEWESLRARNFRFVKVSAATLSAIGRGAAEAGMERRAFRKRLRDAGLDLIAEKIEREDDMPEILSMGLDFGQGHLFGAPRPAQAYLGEAAGGAVRRKAAVGA